MRRSSSARACATLRGKPSRTLPCTSPRCSMQSSTSPMMRSSGTRSPRSRYGCAALPNGVPCAIALRSSSPLAQDLRCSSATRRCACVPLPDPWAPIRMRFTAGSSLVVLNATHPTSRVPARPCAGTRPVSTLRTGRCAGGRSAELLPDSLRRPYACRAAHADRINAPGPKLAAANHRPPHAAHDKLGLGGERADQARRAHLVRNGASAHGSSHRARPRRSPRPMPHDGPARRFAALTQRRKPE